MAETFNPIARNKTAPGWWRSQHGRFRFSEVYLMLLYSRLDELAAHG